MRVGVDQPGHHQPAAEVDRLVEAPPLRRAGGPNLGDAVVLDHDAAGLVQRIACVEGQDLLGLNERGGH